jgi:hypothetical protein
MPHAHHDQQREEYRPGAPARRRGRDRELGLDGRLRTVRSMQQRAAAIAATCPTKQHQHAEGEDDY